MENNQAESRTMIETLAMTEGWGKLTPKQRQVIRASLSVTDRAYRRRTGRVMLHLDEVEAPDVSSKNHIASEYCYTAVMGLERGKLVTGFDADESVRIDERFHETSDIDLTGKQDRPAYLAGRIRRFGFPCVVQPGADPSVITPPSVHSFVVLGKGPDDKLYCWDKQGLGLPYRVITLDEEFAQYKGLDHWGIRALRNLGAAKAPNATRG